MNINLFNYTNIPNFAGDVLRLKGIEKEIYSIIYGFSQDSESRFTGSINYLCRVTLFSRKTVSDTLKSLSEYNLIIKYVKDVNGVQFCEYAYNKETLKEKLSEYENSLNNEESEDYTPSVKITTPHVEITHNIIDNNIDINIKEKIYKKESSEKEIFEEFRKIYKGTKRGLDTEFTNFIKKHKDHKSVVLTLKESFLNQEEIRAVKKSKGEFVPEYANLQTWINQRRWENEDSLEFNEIEDETKHNRYIAYLKAVKDIPLMYIKQLSETEFSELIDKYPPDLILQKIREISNKPNGARWLYEEIKIRIKNGQ